MDFRDDKPDAYMRFAECGFSERIIGVLIKAGLDAPEQLLSMAPDRIRLIQGIGPTLIKEIEQYRAAQNRKKKPAQGGNDVRFTLKSGHVQRN